MTEVEDKILSFPHYPGIRDVGSYSGLHQPDFAAGTTETKKQRPHSHSLTSKDVGGSYIVSRGSSDNSWAMILSSRDCGASAD